MAEAALKLSKVMIEVLERIKRNGGFTVRTAGGFWWPGENMARSHSSVTVQALVDRGILVYTEWKEGKNYRFPVRADVASQKKE